MPIRQLEHHEIKNNEHQLPLVVLCNDITSAENVGMIFRISEAMGVKTIYLCGDTPSPEHKKVKKTARSTEKYIHYQAVKNITTLMLELKAENYTNVALEVTSASTPLNKTDFTQWSKIALIVGNEQHGIDNEALKIADASVEIPMYGQNTSINVVNSLSIGLYEIVRQMMDKSS